MDSKKKPAACTQPPWRFYIPEDIRDKVVRQIRAECNDIYGQSYDQCPKRMVCMGKSCLGRPLPWKSPTAKPYLEEMVKQVKMQKDEMLIEGCEICPFAKECKKPCRQINDYLNRNTKKEVSLVYKENLENVSQENETDIIALPDLAGKEIPWDVLNDRKKEVVKKRLYERVDFLTIAKQLDLNNQARAKYEYYAALNKLSEYAVMRQFLSEASLTPKQTVLLDKVYFENKTLTSAAEELNITKQAAQQTLARVLKKYDIRWHKFVRKKRINGKDKVIYNIPEVIR